MNETVPEQRRPGKREDQVCLTLSAATQLHHIHGIHRLLTYRGGEAIYWQHCEGSPDLATKLRSLGVPSVVTALLELAAPGQERHSVFPSVVHVFVGKALGLSRPTPTCSTDRRSHPSGSSPSCPPATWPTTGSPTCRAADLRSRALGPFTASQTPVGPAGDAAC